MRFNEINKPIDFTQKKKERDLKKSQEKMSGIKDMVQNAFGNQAKIEKIIKQKIEELQHSSNFEELPQVPLFRKDYMKGLPSYEYIILNLPLIHVLNGDNELSYEEKYAVEYVSKFHDEIQSAGQHLINQFQELNKIAEKATAPQYPKRDINAEIGKIRRLLEKVNYIQKYFEKDSLNEAKKEQKRFYHGTSSTFLPSILKHGLLSNPPQKVWGGGSGWESYGGVYVTKGMDTIRSTDDAVDAAFNAVDNFGGVPIVLEVKTVIASTVEDEDQITYLFDEIFQKIFKIEDSSETYDFSNWDYFFNLLKDELQSKKYKTNKITFSIIDEIKRFLKSNKVKFPELSHYSNNLLVNLKEEYPQLRPWVDYLTKNLIITDARTKRILQPVKYKGNTRIVRIYQYDSDRDKWKIVYPTSKKVRYRRKKPKTKTYYYDDTESGF